MAQTRSKKGSSQSRSNGGQRQRKQSDYEETPDYGTAFHRPDNEPPQPRYTGQGMLDTDTARAIVEAGGEFQIAVWTKRTRQGLKVLRFHIEPPWEGAEDADNDDDFDDEDPDGEDDGGAPF